MKRLSFITGVAAYAMGLTIAVLADQPTHGNGQTHNTEQASQLIN